MVYTDLLFYCSLGLLCCGGWMPERVSAIPCQKGDNTYNGYTIGTHTLDTRNECARAVQHYGARFNFSLFTAPPKPKPYDAEFAIT
uniref:Putative secreted peptide n=1 Tax=Anopheles braziliensis TaxID=58242 RepID=A0A2M3ZP45_9DIPT